MPNWATVRRLAILLGCGLLQACGGGGSGGASTDGGTVSTNAGGQSSGGSGTSSSSAASFTLTQSSVSALAYTGETAPSAIISGTVSGYSGTVYVGIVSSTSGVASAAFASSSGNLLSFTLQLKAPATLGPGTYLDTAKIRVCFDSTCTQPLSGSPVSIPVQYTVKQSPTITFATTSLSQHANVTDASGATVVLTPQVVNPNGASIVFEVQVPPINGISSVIPSTESATAPQLTLTYKNPATLGLGTYNDTFTVTACIDAPCAHAIQSFTFNSAYQVTEPALTVTSQLSLTHDVVAAAYSRTLDAIVMTSASPSNALYVYDTATGTETAQALSAAPTALSLDPSGLHAAVGHAAAISYVDLAALLAGSSALQTLNVSIPVGQLVLDGNGYVHAFNSSSNSDYVHSINIASNTENLSASPVIEVEQATLQPASSYLYALDVSPSFNKLDVSSGTATSVEYKQPSYGICGRFWFDDGGATLFSGCGAYFSTSAVNASDLAYQGTLQIIPPQNSGSSFSFRSLDYSMAANEIAAVDTDSLYCGSQPSKACQTDVNLYDATTLSRNAVYWLPDVVSGGATYPQWGQYTFHSADGTHRYLISQLYNYPSVSGSYLISTF